MSFMASVHLDETNECFRRGGTMSFACGVNAWVFCRIFSMMFPKVQEPSMYLNISSYPTVLRALVCHRP